MLVLKRTKSNQLLYMQALLRRLHEHDEHFSHYQTELNNLQAGLQDGKKKKEMIIAALEASGIEPTRRGETLTIEEFGRLADALHPNFSKQ